jgi:RHS repeat-associated protein
VGSLRVVADSAGNVVKRIDYDSFGNIIEGTSTSFEISFGFAGGLHDRDTGFVRFGYRDYDPDIGRWAAKDPIGFAGGDTDLFGYCLNDPVNLIDPFGLWSAWGGTTGVASWGPWGGNAGSGIAYDSGSGIGGYTTTGTTTGAGASVGYEAGFYTGSISGKTEIASLGLGPVSIGFVTNDGGSWGWGFVFGFAWGAPAEGTISNNNTIFYPMFDGETNPCP